MVHKHSSVFTWLPVLIVMAACSCGSPKAKQPSIKATRAGTENNIRNYINGRRFLTYHVKGFQDCHSRPDFNRFAGPSIPGIEGRGGRLFCPGLDEPGQVFNRTIWSTELIDRTKEKLAIATSEGIHKKGNTGFTQVPGMAYVQMAATDIQDVIRYIRHLAPKERSFLSPILFIPLEASMSPQSKPDRSKHVKDSNEDPVKSGRIFS